MRHVIVSAIQMAFSQDRQDNHDRLLTHIHEACRNGSQVVVMPELPSGHYFCKRQDPSHFQKAESLEDAALIHAVRPLARQYQAVIPVSFFERCHNRFFNSLAIVDSDGELLGVYRKSHIPDGIGYMEKFYFSPGTSGFKVWQTRWGTIGAGICWDQWFPEAARSMALDGADILLYPTAIGSEPHLPDYDSSQHWRRVMQGHAGANMLPVVAANRIGVEACGEVSTGFYGQSFISDHTGAIVETANSEERVITHQFDLDAISETRHAWGLFRDRRPDLYQRLCDED